MKFTTLTRRAVTAGAASALVAGVLVASSPAANAASATSSYLCTAPTSDTFTLDLASTVDALDAIDEYAAGAAVPGGLPVTNVFTMDAAAVGLMNAFGVTDVSFPDFAATFGNASIPVTGMVATTASLVDNGDGTSSFDADGTTGAARAPRAGQQLVTTPSAFTMNVKSIASPDPIPVPCALTGDAGVLKTITVTKNASTSNARAVNSPTRKGQVAKVRVKVTAPNHKPTGKVVLKRGKKTVASGKLNRRGVVVLKTRALRVGKNRLVTQYKGDGYTRASTDKLVFKVRR